jgi:adenosylmethionine-8-amino-7-oxononanoate aminotransferase
LAKGIAGGYLPLAATLATEQVYEAFLDEPERFKQFFHGHTFTANPLACAAALASLHLFDENQVLDHVQHIAKTLHQGLMQMAPKRPIRSIRQTGVMVGIDLDDDTHGAGHRAAMRAREHGVILRPLGNTLVINPPLSLSEYEAQMLLGATRRALKPA